MQTQTYRLNGVTATRRKLKGEKRCSYEVSVPVTIVWILWLAISWETELYDISLLLLGWIYGKWIPNAVLLDDAHIKGRNQIWVFDKRWL